MAEKDNEDTLQKRIDNMDLYVSNGIPYFTSSFINTSVMNQYKWDLRFLELAKHVSIWSKDPSTKCGAIIAKNKKVLGIGYNGFPAGTDDNPAIYADRPRKIARVVHAELNAVYAALKTGEELAGATLYTYPPGLAPTCDRCAAHVIQAGIRRIVFFKEDNEFTRRWSPEEALQLYKEAGVEIVALTTSTIA